MPQIQISQLGLGAIAARVGEKRQRIGSGKRTAETGSPNLLALVDYLATAASCVAKRPKRLEPGRLHVGEWGKKGEQKQPHNNAETSAEEREGERSCVEERRYHHVTRQQSTPAGPAGHGVARNGAWTHACAGPVTIGGCTIRRREAHARRVSWSVGGGGHQGRRSTAKKLGRIRSGRLRKLIGYGGPTAVGAGGALSVDANAVGCTEGCEPNRSGQGRDVEGA